MKIALASPTMPLFPEVKRESASLLRLAGPIILSQVAQVLSGMLDVVMSGQAGAQEQAVVGLGVALWIPIFVSLMSVVQAISPVVARHVGAGDHLAAVRDAREGVMLAAVIGLLPLALVPMAPAMLRWFGVEAGLAERTEVFLWGIGLGLPAAMVYRALAFFSASINETRPVMIISFVGLASNGFLNWVLIGGHLGAPALGGAGCGWATGIGMWLALALLFVWTRHARAYKPYFLWNAWQRPHWAAQRHLLAIGLPMGGAAFAEVAAFAGIAVLLGRFGDVQIAAQQIALNVSALTFMLPMGVSAAVTVHVGQALGAQDPVKARFISWTGLATGLAIAVGTTGLLLVCRDLVAAAYSSDAKVRVVASRLLLFAAVWQIFDAAQVCAIGALRGYKQTVLPMLAMLVAFWVVGIPVGAWLGWHGWVDGEPMMAEGFWTGLLAGLVLAAIGLVLGMGRVARGALTQPGA